MHLRQKLLQFFSWRRTIVGSLLLIIITGLLFNACSPIRIKYEMVGENLKDSTICLDSLCKVFADLEVKKMHYSTANYLHLLLTVTNRTNDSILLSAIKLKIKSKKFDYKEFDVKISSNRMGEFTGDTVLSLSKPVILQGREVNFCYTYENETYSKGFSELRDLLRDEELAVTITLNANEEMSNVNAFKFRPVTGSSVDP